MAELFGKIAGAAAGAAARCISSTQQRASTAATRSSAAAYRSRSASRSRTRCGARSTSPPASSAKARPPRGSSTNRSTSRRCGDCRCCSAARTTSTRWAPRSRAPQSETDIHARPRATASRSRAVDGMDVFAVESSTRGRRRRGARGRRTAVSSNSGPIAFGRTRCSIPSCIASQEEVEAWRAALSDRDVDGGIALAERPRRRGVVAHGAGGGR